MIGTKSNPEGPGESKQAEKTRCVNNLLADFNISVTPDLVDAVIQLADLTPIEVQDIIDYSNGFDIEGDLRYESVDAYLEVLGDRLADAVQKHDLQKEVN